jgi:hypothetical protein
VNTDALAAFSTKKTSSKAAWRPPEIIDFPYRYARTVMAFDPSLRACGAVALTITSVRGVPTIMVDAAKKFVTTDHAMGGFEESLRKTLELSEQIGPWILTELRGHHLAGIEFVHEGPPVGGGKVIRPETALLAGAAVRFALAPMGLTVHPMIQPQTHKRLWCGPRSKNQTITKKEHHDAMMARAQELAVVGLDKITNEATRDAFSVACMHLTRPQEVRL